MCKDAEEIKKSMQEEMEQICKDFKPYTEPTKVGIMTIGVDLAKGEDTTVVTKQGRFNVYLDGEVIDTVWYLSICDEDYVKSSLINHDGYDPNISVVRE